MLETFIRALQLAHIDCTDEDIADALWLALHLNTPSGQDKRVQTAERGAKNEIETTQQDQRSSTVNKSSGETPLPTTNSEISSTLHSSAQKRSGTRQAQTGAMPFRTPIVSSLSKTLDLSRALRPLQRRIPSLTSYVLDEQLTAQQMADQLLSSQPFSLPVLRPVYTHWFDVALVVDENRSMSIWQSVIREFKLLLERLGAFRDVRSWSLSINDDYTISLHANWPKGNKTRPRSPQELIDPGGRRLILVVSDCISNVWYADQIAKLFQMWGRSGPVALVQVLPLRLWSRSALGNFEEVQLRAEQLGSPNSRLTYTPVSYLAKEQELKGRLPIPTISLTADSLHTWVQATIMARNVWTPGYIFKQSTPPDPTLSGILSAEEKLQRFSLFASSKARRLLRLFAAAPLNLPIIRLIQHEMLPESDLGHVAEVLFSGLIEQISTRRGDYDFVPGVRELLLDTMPRSESRRVFMAVSRFIQSKKGHTGDILTWLADPDTSSSLFIGQENRPFAAVAIQVMYRLGGNYRELAKRVEQQQARMQNEEFSGHSTVKIGSSTYAVTKISNSSISSFTHFFLERCNFEGVDPLRVQKRTYGPEDVQQLERLASRLGTHSPRERAAYYLSAAKIIYEQIEEWEDGYNQLFHYLYCSFASRGDAAIVENRPQDTAREWYCEALSVYDADRSSTHSEREEATHVLIRSLFAILGRASVPINTSHPGSLRLDECLDQIIQNHPQPMHVFEAIAYLVFHSQFAANRVLNRLWTIPHLHQQALDYLRQKQIAVPGGVIDEGQFIGLWKVLQLKFTEQERAHSVKLRPITQQVELKQASVEQWYKVLREIEAFPFFDLDRQRLQEVLKVFETMADLCVQTAFEEKERRCHQIDHHCKGLLREIEADPTRLSVENFYPIAQAIEAKINHYLEELYTLSEPRLALRLPEGMTAYTPERGDPRFELQIVVSNKVGCSPAETIQLVIQEDPDRFSVELEEIRLEGSLRGGEQRIIRVPIRVTAQALEEKAFSLPLYAQYRTRSAETKQTDGVPVSINLSPMEAFQPIDNPYALYAQGGIAGDKNMFYGRTELIAYISQVINTSWTQSKAIVIFGQKRSGKSSILYHLKERLQNNPDLLVINLGSMRSYLDEHSRIPLFYQILWSILHELSLQIDDAVSAGRSPLDLSFPEAPVFYAHPTPLLYFRELLAQFQRTARTTADWHTTRIVLLIDEFSYLYGLILAGKLPEDFMKNWKALLQDNFFSVVMAGQDVMPRFMQRFPNEFASTQGQQVGYLSIEDARKLIDEPILLGGRSGQSRYRERAIERIIELTGGSPFYIQIICDRLVEYMNRKRISLVTEADIEQVKQELIQGINSLGWDKFDNLTNSGDTSPDAIPEEDTRAVLKVIALNSRTGPCSRSRILVDTTTEIATILDDLAARAVLEVHQSNYYTIRVGLFKEWLLAHI
jgi:hypothetical protein